MCKNNQIIELGLNLIHLIAFVPSLAYKGNLLCFSCQCNRTAGKHHLSIRSVSENCICDFVFLGEPEYTDRVY